MKQQSGFTLIELVVVIIVLGILAVTAAPKFIDLQSDARTATLSGAKGALQSANALIFSKAAINGDQKLDCTASPKPAGCNDIDVPGSVDVTPVYGSLAATAAQIQAATELSTDEWDINAASGKAYITPKGVTHLPAQDGSSGKTDACQVIYTPATSAAEAKYLIVSGKC